MHPAKDYTLILAALREQGWSVDQTSKHHIKCVPPDKDKDIVVFSMSNSDHRAFDNTLNSLKRQGLAWPPPEEVLREPVFAIRSEDPQSLLEHIRESGGNGISSVIGMQHEADEMNDQPIEPEPDMDQIYAALKDAKTEAQLSDLHLSECQAKLLAAKREVEMAQEECKTSHHKLREKKAEFDRTFGSTL